MSPHNLLVFSDVHLGSDLVHYARPDAPAKDAAAELRDQQLCALLDWYREHPRGGLPWRLVIAGDFVDFVGMCVAAPPAGTGTPLDADDRALGLGSAEDHTIYKLRCVARRHATVFERLARFVAAGNDLVLIRGNHDVDFHWPAVQDEFVRQLSTHAPIERGRVEFAAWFYYEEGRVFVEHGHQYDRYCAYDHILHPVSPGDPKRSSRSLSDVLLRHVVRPTRGMRESGHESMNAFDYIAFGLRLGLGGLVGLATRFARAVGRLIALWREHFSEAARRVRVHHERRMEDLASLLDVKLEALRSLSGLHRPVTRSLRELAGAVMLDRVAIGAFALSCAGLAFLLGRFTHAVAITTGVVIAALVASKILSRLRAHVDPRHELQEGAARVARLFPAAFVVMGHTHIPEVRPDADGHSTYVNLGAWADEEGQSHKPGVVASRTHLVLEVRDDGQEVAELRVWDTVRGPRRFI